MQLSLLLLEKSQDFASRIPLYFHLNCIRDGTLEKWWGGGGAIEVQKKIFAQGKIKWKKIHARQLTLKNIHATA